MSWWLSGGGGQGNVHFTNKAYLVKLSMKGEGGQKSPKNGPHGLCTTPLHILRQCYFWISVWIE